MSSISSKFLSSSLIGLAATASLGLVACGDEGGGGGDIVIDENGEHTQYVINELVIPATATESRNLALDLDGNGMTENALGGLLAALASTADLDLQTGVDEQLADATFILLASIKATDLANADGVGTYILFGANPTPAACTDPMDIMTCGKHLGGMGSFDIAADSPSDAVLAGTLAGGELTTNPGTVSIELPLGDTAPLAIDLIGAQINASVSATGITAGKLGGAITAEDVDNKLIPSVQVLLAELITEGCTPTANDCGCTAGSSGESVLNLFDSDSDCVVPVAELMSNGLIGATLRNPDVDLLDANGDFNPNSDGIPDSLSLAIGFTAVNGSFTLPAAI